MTGVEDEREKKKKEKAIVRPDESMTKHLVGWGDPYLKLNH